MADKAEARAAQELFWLRLTAAAIDVAAMVVIAQIAAVALYAASDGMLRSSSAFSRVARCQPMAAISPKLMEGLPRLPNARPVAARLCSISTVGLETGRYVTVALQSQVGEVTRSLAFSRPVDRLGLPVKPLILDWAYPLAFILLMSLGEGLGGITLGKRLVGLKVAGETGGRLGLGRALLRNLVIYGGAALMLIAPLAAVLMRVRLSQTAYYGAVGVVGLLVLAPFAMLTQAAPRALYDRWAGADVVKA